LVVISITAPNLLLGYTTSRYSSWLLERAIMLFQTLFFTSTVAATCTHGLSMFKRAESAEGSVKIGTFGYDSPAAGPFNWATLAVENEACKNGANQSPINLGKSLLDTLRNLNTRTDSLTCRRISHSSFREAHHEHPRTRSRV
jgi:hypothetical protein